MIKLGFIVLLLGKLAWASPSPQVEEVSYKLVEIEKAYAKANQGFFNECSLKKNYFGLIFIPPFSTIVSESCSEAINLLQQYVEKIALLCERDPKSPISRYFIEEYLPFYCNYKPEQIFEMILFFGFGLGPIEKAEEKFAIQEIILERLVKLDLAKNIGNSPYMENQLREIIEKQNLEKMLTLCESSESPYLQEMGQRMQGYKTIDQYLNKIDLKEEFYEVLKSSLEEDRFLKEEIQRMLQEYIQQRDQLTKGLV